MRILVINGGCLRNNSSANLCHLAYIRGLQDSGDNEITVLSENETGQIIDESIVLPKGPRYIEFPGSFLYHFIRPSQWSIIQNDIQNKRMSFKAYFVSFAKKLIKNFYGPFGYSGVWVNKVVNGFKDKEEYDIVISISSPVYSHIAAIRLIEYKRVKCNKYIEIWEDPWQLDLYNHVLNEELFEMEHGIVKKADKVVYVSPITAKIQARFFKDCESKIIWEPLPYYYCNKERKSFFELSYGYFGDYFPVARNLRPFYEAAILEKIHVCLCGSPETLFESTDLIEIHPRLQLSELNKYESQTNVLIYLCNVRGGQIPGKIYQYAATYNKILFILDGTDDERAVIRRMFECYNRFVFCENNVDSIVKAIRIIENGQDHEVINTPLDCFSPEKIIHNIIHKALDERKI